jgi:hypothetical protein
MPLHAIGSKTQTSTTHKTNRCFATPPIVFMLVFKRARVQLKLLEQRSVI